MRKRHLLGIGAVVVLGLAGGVAGGLGSSSMPQQPAAMDVTECNEYARWMAERAISENPEDLAKPHGRLLSTGTVEGLADAHQEDARAAQAYRRCMARRGYKVWG